jgi:hypothetical protein
MSCFTGPSASSSRSDVGSVLPRGIEPSTSVVKRRHLDCRVSWRLGRTTCPGARPQSPATPAAGLLTARGLAGTVVVIQRVNACPRRTTPVSVQHRARCGEASSRLGCAGDDCCLDTARRARTVAPPHERRVAAQPPERFLSRSRRPVTSYTYSASRVPQQIPDKPKPTTISAQLLRSWRSTAAEHRKLPCRARWGGCPDDRGVRLSWLALPPDFGVGMIGCASFSLSARLSGSKRQNNI